MKSKHGQQDQYPLPGQDEVTNNIECKELQENISDFEAAISATGFGKFNILLLLYALPLAWAVHMTTAVTSFISPFAACDLNLTLQDKGTLNAIVYTGMISSGLIWGYLSDTLGRKKLIVIGFLINGILVVLTGLSQNFTLVLIFKFLDGFTISGPHAAFMAALSEFSSAKYRAKTLMLVGIMLCLSSILVPLVGSAILTATSNFSILNDFIVLHSWNIFILVSALPSLFSGFAAMLLPESPKFLMTNGENNKALEVFKKIYTWNSGYPQDSYPVKVLIDEKLIAEKSVKNKICPEDMSAIQIFKNNMKPLFSKPHGPILVIVCAMHFGMLGGTNMLRLWLPQILTTINDYVAVNGEDSNFCNMIAMLRPTNESNTCLINKDVSIFYNSMVPPAFIMLLTLIAGIVINSLGKKNIYFICGLISGIGTICVYFASNTIQILILFTISTGLSNTCTTIMVAMVVDLFPTTLRAMSVSFIMLSGRLGSMIGNIMFPMLLSMGCLPPFATLGIVIMMVTLLVVFLPGTDLKPLE